MKKDRDTRELLAMVRAGLRLKTKPPKKETPKSVYNRREKHRRRWNDTSSSLFNQPLFLDRQDVNRLDNELHGVTRFQVEILN